MSDKLIFLKYLKCKKKENLITNYYLGFKPPLKHLIMNFQKKTFLNQQFKNCTYSTFKLYNNLLKN